MRIDILAIGSRGDVQPYVALGLGLQGAGHCVRIVTLGGFEDIVRGRGLGHLAIADSPQEIANTAAGRQWIRDRSSNLGFLRGLLRVAGSHIEEAIARYWHAGQDTELLILSPMGIPVGIQVAERLRAPFLRAQVEPPAVATSYGWDGHRSPLIAARRRWTAFLITAANFIFWHALRGSTNAARRRILALPPLPLMPRNLNRVPLLCGYSPAVVPRLPDFSNWIHVTGYWFLDDLPGWTPPRGLADFLRSGPPPVFVGFGSTPFPQPEATARLVVRALQRAGRRGVLVAGGSGLTTGQLTDDVFGVEFAPYGWLFPQVSAAVHQGGAGVTAAALRAGLPCVVVPVFGVHPFWGNRLFELGVGPRPIPAPRLTADNLARAIQAAGNGEMRRRAAAIGEQIRAEDGVARAVEIVDEHLRRAVGNAVRSCHAD